jgi:heat shock protein HtpX
MGVAAMIAYGIMRVVSQVFRPPVALFKMIVWRESQRAEFEADRMAARVAGPEVAMGLLEKLQLRDAVHSIVGAAAVQDPGCNVLDRIRERARLRAAMQLEDARFDATHPPTRHRVELLRGFPRALP